MDSVLEKNAKRWYLPPTTRHEKGAKHLQQLTANIQLDENGIALHDVEEYLEKEGITKEMVQAVGFETVAHYLFHLEDIFEVRSRIINGQDFYFLFAVDKIKGKSRPSTKKASKKVDTEYEWTLSSFSKVLNLNRNSIIPAKVIKSDVAEEKGRLTKKEDMQTSNCPKETPATNIEAGNEQILQIKPKKDPKEDELTIKDRSKAIRDTKSGPIEPLSEVAGPWEVEEARTVLPSHPIVKIKRTFVFEPPREPNERYRPLKNSSTSNWSTPDRRRRTSFVNHDHRFAR